MVWPTLGSRTAKEQNRTKPKMFTKHVPIRNSKPKLIWSKTVGR